MNVGELNYAIRRAHNIFDKWNDVVAIIPKNTGYYYEMLSVIEDAVHCGAQQALKDIKQLESEMP